MFWIWYEWQLFAKPYSLESDMDTIKMNDRSLTMWRSMPERYRGMAITIEVITESD